MSWSSASRAALITVALVAPLLLAGCSGLRPVYGTDGIGQQQLAFRYGQPATRVDQIIIQELGLRLGRGGTASAPEIRVTTTTGSCTLTRTGVTRPATHREMTVTATFSVVAPDGEVVLTGQRRATAQYTTSGQVLADESAAQDARERAARAVADTIRLTILAELAAPAREALVIR